MGRALKQFDAGVKSVCVAFACMALAACTTTARAPLTAALGGSSAAATTGSQTYLAALQGGIIGRLPSADLGRADRQRALEAEYRALEAAPGGQPVAWKGSAISGEVVAAAPYQVGSQNCRQYSHTIVAGSQTQTARGVACRNPNGSWTPLG
ncbi:hypothetical protein [Rhizobium sp. RU20A]|uniref:hypothetical protein n=1 Tax=Rhizobium sp. RU20A TaxID=1907412 RepID=UPI00122C3CE4|nr:hypothetical protein [Rhizobium sp. RU20A]